MNSKHNFSSHTIGGSLGEVLSIFMVFCKVVFCQHCAIFCMTAGRGLCHSQNGLLLRWKSKVVGGGKQQINRLDAKCKEVWKLTHWGWVCFPNASQNLVSHALKIFYFFNLILLKFVPKVPDNNESSLTHWGWDKMDAISQTTFSKAFSWMKIFEFRLKFHWSLFPRVQ